MKSERKEKPHGQKQYAPHGLVAKQVEQADADFLREAVSFMVSSLMDAEASAICGERTPERANKRNGYRERDWDTRVGTIRARHPKAPQGQPLPLMALGAAQEG